MIEAMFVICAMVALPFVADGFAKLVSEVLS